MSDPADELLADLADAVLTLAREIQLRHDEDPGIISLTPTARMVMRHVHQHAGSSPSEIGAQLGLRRPNVSEALRKLEQLGLVERTRPAGDGRTVVVTITPLAETNLARMRRIWARALSPVREEGVDARVLDDTVRRLADELTATRVAAQAPSTPAA